MERTPENIRKSIKYFQDSIIQKNHLKNDIESKINEELFKKDQAVAKLYDENDETTLKKINEEIEYIEGEIKIYNICVKEIYIHILTEELNIDKVNCDKFVLPTHELVNSN